jgi:PQ loop repeat
MRHLHSVAFRKIVTLLFVLVSAVAFVNGIPSKQALSRARRSVTGVRLKLDHSHAASVVAAASAVAAPSTIGTVVAKALGYVIGAGSLAVYLPIVISLWKKKSADGFSVATWVFNLMGITLAVIYPLKKGFPMSTFVELVLLVIQSTGILGEIMPS